MKSSILRLSILIAFVMCSNACGREGPPLPPEYFAPEQVQALKVSGAVDGVNFYWEAPSTDQQGKELKSIDGYKIYRKKIERTADIIDTSVPFQAVTSVTDTHLLELEKERQKFRSEGKPAHRARIAKELTVFNFTDSGVSSGATYIYKVVPTNQGNVESDSFQLVKVLWRGESSEIVTVDSSVLSMEEDSLGSAVE